MQCCIFHRRRRPALCPEARDGLYDTKTLADAARCPSLKPKKSNVISAARPDVKLRVSVGIGLGSSSTSVDWFRHEDHHFVGKPEPACGKKQRRRQVHRILDRAPLAKPLLRCTAGWSGIPKQRDVSCGPDKKDLRDLLA